MSTNVQILFYFVLIFNAIHISVQYSLPTSAIEFNLEDRDVQCPSQIYCYGQLLDTVQRASLFQDSKTFVDMKLKQSPDETLRKFNEMMTSHNNTPTNDDLKKFVDDNFLEPGQEFTDWDPSDWTEKPRFLDVIYDPELRSWGSALNDIWKILGRKMIDDVAKNPDLYSIIPVEHPVIVPGGRFREFYYWDSYWIVRGLLYSEMFDTVRGMLQNFLSIVDRFGYIPNGGRIYYTKRSQPPLLAPMIKSYVEFTGDDKFGIESVELLEREFDFWMRNHTVDVNGHTLFLYGDKSTGPRPESYREDFETSKKYDSYDAKEEYYAELKAGAESGMDFSSRWFIDDQGSNTGNLTNIKARSIVPVELNAFLFWNARIIAEFSLKAGNLEKAAKYEQKSQEIYDAIQSVLWNDDVGAWLDYDLINKKQRNFFTPTNLSPLWMKCFDIKNSEKVAEKVLKYINDTGIDRFPGGVPNTLQNTGEQWDFPNVWPPMQYILIAGLESLGTLKSKSLAYDWAERWVKSNYLAYKETKHMFEKYNAEEVGGHGGGGEYDIQLGFGWTNGVIIELLTRYGHRLSTTSSGGSNSTTSPTGSGSSAESTFNNIFSHWSAITVGVLVTTVGSLIW